MRLVPLRTSAMAEPVTQAQPDPDSHADFVARKVAAARASLQAGLWYDDAVVEAHFAALRARTIPDRDRRPGR